MAWQGLIIFYFNIFQEELAGVKKRNEQLCFILAQGESKSKKITVCYSNSYRNNKAG